MSIKNNIKLIKDKINILKKPNQQTELIVVSKNYSSDKIKIAIEAGCNIFGENKIQEAKSKWINLKNEYPHIQLHLIGHLQSNKVREAVKLFDVIEVLDSIKLAEKLEKEIIRQNKNPKILIQINISQEKQKSGIPPEDLGNFLKELKKFPKLNITGIMTIAFKNKDSDSYFKKMNQLAKKYDMKEISMGMSADYEIAIKNNSNFIRIGSAIFSNFEK